MGRDKRPDITLERIQAFWNAVATCREPFSSEIEGGTQANSPVFENGGTLLMLAAQMGYIPEAQILLDYGANINLQDYDGYTALMTAALERQEAMAAFLLKKGANPRLKNKRGQTALDIAQKRKAGNISKLLQEYLSSH